MEKGISIREWVKRFNNKEWDQPDCSTQCEAGWYDWFCKDSSLLNKTRRMGRIIKQIKDGGKVNLDSDYVFFKNNCPCVGPLYDSFKICDSKSNNVILCICLDDRREDTKYTVYGRTPSCPEGMWANPIVGFDTSKDLVKWLNTSWKNK